MLATDQDGSESGQQKTLVPSAAIGVEHRMALELGNWHESGDPNQVSAAIAIHFQGIGIYLIKVSYCE